VTDQGPAALPPVADISYAQASAELDVIIADLDQGLVDVDLLEARFRRAIEIVEELDRRIRGARERVDALMPRLEALGGDASAAESGGDG
jgi:exodeoxyribonuclease VII small subunit